MEPNSRDSTTIEARQKPDSKNLPSDGSTRPAPCKGKAPPLPSESIYASDLRLNQLTVNSKSTANTIRNVAIDKIVGLICSRIPAHI